MRDALRGPAGTGAKVLEAVPVLDPVPPDSPPAVASVPVPVAVADLVPPVEILPVPLDEVLTPLPVPAPKLVEEVLPEPKVVEDVEPGPMVADLVVAGVGESGAGGLLARGGDAGSVVEGMDSEATGPADDMPLRLELSDIGPRIVMAAELAVGADPVVPPLDDGAVPVPAVPPVTPPPGSDGPQRTGGRSQSELGARVWAVVAPVSSDPGATTGRAPAAQH